MPFCIILPHSVTRCRWLRDGRDFSEEALGGCPGRADSWRLSASCTPLALKRALPPHRLVCQALSSRASITRRLILVSVAGRLDSHWNQ